MEKQESLPLIKFYSRRQGYFEFTNFYLAPIMLDGKEYPTTEHYYQSLKFAGTFIDFSHNCIIPDPRR